MTVRLPRIVVAPTATLHRMVVLPPEEQAREALLAEAEELRDTAALLEADARTTRQKAQALIAGLLDDHRRRVAANPQVDVRRGKVTGDQLRRARALAHVSQRQLAAAWGYSRGAIAAYEDDHSPHRVPEGIAEWALGQLRTAGELAPAADAPFAMADPEWEQDAAPVRGVAPFPSGLKGAKP
jgi:DNA-binding XRE family transcriptional regulator